MAGRLAGKVVLISGGARGQGAVEGTLFAREGAGVVLGDILDGEGQQIMSEIKAAGGQAVYVHLDVTKEAEWQQAVETAVRTFGKLTVLVNNAGILYMDGALFLASDESSYITGAELVLDGGYTAQ